jgi:protein-S-isoprenylcysteine O-methyltransferase Ste14
MPVALSGALLFWLAFRCLKLQATTIEPRGTPTSLVERGPYRFTRNPIYLGYLLVAFGVTFFLNDVVAFAAPLIFFITVNTFVIPYEERMLTLTFGARYEDYKQRIRRWI